MLIIKRGLTYALLDSMSNTSIITEDLCDSIQTPRKRLRVSTVTDSQVQWSYEVNNLQLRGFNKGKSESILVPTLYTQSSIPADKGHIPIPETALAWSHLKQVADQLTPLQDCGIGLIIGYNCSAASLPLNTIRHTSDLTLPYAIQTVLGWAVVGWAVVGGKEANDRYMGIHRTHIQDVTMERLVRCLEDDPSEPHSQPPKSQNDTCFMKMMESSVTQVNGFYTLPLPFKRKPDLPDNRSYAMKRFRSLEYCLQKDGELASRYNEFMADVISKGEAEPVGEPAEPGWYIPHHGVYHPRKPGTLRVAFDCSATFKGHSLNDTLLQGPDLNSNLAGLLCRFQKEKVAVTCDIRKMFHQFRVPVEDRMYLCFLLYGPDGSSIIDYHMNVHLFGAKSLPSCSIYGLQKIVDDNSESFPKAATFVKQNFHVDDGLIRVPSGRRSHPFGETGTNDAVS